MSDTPGFVRDFSRRTAKKERHELAASVVAEKRKKMERERKIAELEAKLEGAKAGRHGLTPESLRDTAAAIAHFEKTLQELRESRFARLFRRKEMERQRLLLEKLYAEHGEEQALSSLKESRSADREPEDMLMDFYEKERQRWQEAPVDWEDIERYFNPRHLSSLPLEKYVELLRRFPQEMVTHVSRRGIRDHAELSEHQDERPDMWHDDFDKVLAAKNLQSAIGIKLEGESKETFIEKELGIWKATTSEEAQSLLKRQLQDNGWASFADHSAVHFAAEEAADMFYGSERQNEVFVVYPSALVANTYEFGGQGATFFPRPNTDKTRNDIWVWTKEEAGIPLDAGIVFLPKDAAVDPETGSRYALTEQYEAQPATEYIELLDRLTEDSGFLEFLEDTHRKQDAAERQAHDKTWDLKRKASWGEVFDEKRAKREAYEEFSGDLERAARQRLQDEYSINSERLLDILLSRSLTQEAARLVHAARHKDWEYAAIRDQLLRSANIYLKFAEDTVPSQDFWEDYFTKHPDRRPSKVVYYEGGDPTAAFKKWREDNGITRTVKDFDIDYQRQGKDYTASSGTHSRFATLAQEVITRHFEKQAPPIKEAA